MVSHVLSASVMVFLGSFWLAGPTVGDVEHMGKPSKTIAETPQHSITDCSVLDTEFLDRVTFGDSPLRNELIGLFQSQIVSALSKLPGMHRPEDWTFTAHSLRGAAAAIGAEQIAALCARWEEEGLPRSPARRKECHDELKAAEQRFIAALATLRP